MCDSASRLQQPAAIVPVTAGAAGVDSLRVLRWVAVIWLGHSHPPGRGVARRLLS